MDELFALLASSAGGAVERLLPLRAKLASLYADVAPALAPLLERCAPVQALLQSEPLFYINALGDEDDAAAGGGDPASNDVLAASPLSPALLELDTMCLGLILLTVCHATLHHKMLWLLVYAMIAIGAEQLFIRVGGTHCHAESLLMISQCSSTNSVAAYVPGLYVCLLAAERLQLHPIARPFAAGGLFSLYALPYLAQGTSQQWWAYAPAAAGGPLPLKGAPMWTFAGGWGSTALAPSASTAALLSFRVFGMPTAMPLVAAGVGLGAGVAIAAWRLVQALLMPSPRLWAIVRVPMLLSNALVAGLSGALAGLTAAYVPLGVGLPALMARGASREASLIAMLLLLVVPPLLLPATWPVEVRADLLLFVIVLWHHAYLLIWPAWLNSGLTSGVIPPDLYLGVVVASALSVAAHTRATLYDSLGLDGAVSMGRGLKNLVPPRLCAAMATTAGARNKVRPIIIQGHERPLTMVKYNREGDLLFTAAKDYRPCMWYADNGERIGTFEGHTGTVWCIDVNYDSTHLLTGSADNMCKIWDIKTGVCLHEWKHTGPVRDVRFALGDKQFLTVLDNIMGNQPTIFVWDLDLTKLGKEHPDCPVTTIKGHTSKIVRALWGPVNRAIFSGSDDATLRVWNPESGEQKGIVEGVHQKKITDVQFSWDMTLLVTSCADMWVRLFETSSLTLLKAFNTERNINSAAISPLASCPYLIAAGGQDAMSVTTTAAKQGNFHCSFFDHVFDDELGSIQGHFGPVNTLAYAPHGKSYTSGGEEGYVRIHHFPPEYFESFEQKVAQANGRPWPEK